MARIPMVTRTIKSTKANVLLMNISTKTPEEKEVIVPRTYEKDDKLVKAITTALHDDNLKVCAVLSTEVVETLYGMSEFDFIAHAEVLPPRASGETEDESTSE